MKKFGAIMMIFLGFQLSNGQIMNVNGVDSFFKLDRDVSKDSKESGDVIGKKHLTDEFKPAIINDQNKVLFLRFNIFKNEMEFSKDEGVYYMRKEAGSTVFFRTLNVTYECVNLDGKFTFLKIYEKDNSKKLRLLTKESVRYTKAEKAQRSYDIDKPAKYTRAKDKNYFSLNNEIKEVPRKKKSFYAFFGSDEKNIKDFIKKEKLNYKKTEDLIKIVAHFNTMKDLK